MPATQRLRSIAPALAAAVVLGMIPAFSEAQAPAKPAAKPTVSEKPDPIVEQLVEGHNKERAKEKLPPLKLEAKLTEAAREHAKDMADHGFMGHEGSDDSTPAQRVASAGSQSLRPGENVAAGYKDAAEVILGWMESPAHRKNIMGDYTEIGVARVFDKDDKPYWAVEFGTPMPKFDPANAAKDLVKRINDERVAAKLPALAVDEKLAKAAQDQAANLAKKKSPGGGTANFDGIDQNLYPDVAVSTASGHPDAEAMVKVLLGKDDLKAQVLGKYSRIGTGYALSADGIPYWCLILGNPARTVNSRSRR